MVRHETVITNLLERRCELLRIPHLLAFSTSNSFSFSFLYARRCRMAQGSIFIKVHSLNQLLMNTPFTPLYQLCEQYQCGPRRGV